MDAWGHRALVCVFVIVGCLVAVGPGAVAATDAGTGQNEVGVGIGQNEVGTDIDADIAHNNAYAATTQDGDNGTDQRNGSVAANLSAADEIQVTIHIHENRSATVEVDYRYELDANNESEVDWNGLRADIESNPDAYVAVENESWQETVRGGTNRTDREMELSNFAVTTEESSTPVNLGHVQFRFEWSSFAYSEPKYLEAGDALVGFTLVDHTRLTFRWPESYNATEIRPEPTMREDASAHWDGSEIEFGQDEPRIELIAVGAGTQADEEDLGWGLPWQTGVVIGAVAVAFVATVGLAGWLFARRNDDEPIANGPGAGDPVGRTNAPPPELLSNEEQVIQLLERRGGRLKQQQVVSELDWTEAKTSQVVTGLREAGEIEVFRIGRENVLVLSDDES